MGIRQEEKNTLFDATTVAFVNLDCSSVASESDVSASWHTQEILSMDPRDDGFRSVKNRCFLPMMTIGCASLRSTVREFQGTRQRIEQNSAHIEQAERGWCANLSGYFWH